MQIRRLVTIVLITAMTVTLHAQDDPDWYLNRNIREIQFEGLETVTENELSLVIEPFIGVEFTEQRFLELQRRLYALDLFEQIIPNADRIPENDEEMILRFEVQERLLELGSAETTFTVMMTLDRHRHSDTAAWSAPGGTP